MKVPASLTALSARILADKRLLSATVATAVAIISALGYLGYQELAKRWAVPMVSGANFSLEYRKIPFDAKSIDITFSTDIDPSSLTPQSVAISPFVEGNMSVQNGNTVSYALDTRLTIGETYTFTIGQSVRSVYGKELGQEQTFTFEAIAGAKATKILPNGQLQNLGQNIVVLFNIPVVPLTTLDERDSLPCPLEIAPKVEGKCQWTNGNVLEFIPRKPLEMATKYSLKVANIAGLLYPLAETLTGEIITPELALSTETNGFDPARGMILRTSAPVDETELLGSLALTTQSGTKMEAQMERAKDVSDHESETEFIVTPKTSHFFYATSYGLSVKKGLKPKYGTEPLGADFSVTASSAEFLSDSQVFRKVYDASGALTDTREYNKNFHPFSELIPSEQVFFRQTFMTEVGLDTNLFTLRTASGKTVDFTLAYVKQDTYDERGNKIGVVENKHLIDVTPVVNLENNTIYEFVVNKQANASLSADVAKTYRTAPKFRLLGNTFLSNTETCLSVSTNIDANGMYVSDYATIKTNPISKIHDLMLDEQMDWQTGIKSYRCPQKPGEISYILGTRLEPEKTYSITLPATLEDVYGNKLGKEHAFSVKTRNIEEKDKYLYSSLSRPLQVIPKNLPIVLNLLSINTDRANMEVCEMDVEGYKDYLVRGGNAYYNPECVGSVTKTISLTNRYWNLTPNKIDLEKDVLGKESTSPFLLVRASLGSFNSGGNGYMDMSQEFFHVFARSNLALTLEDAKNTKILFAPSFDGKTLPKNLTFDTYTRNYGQNGVSLEKKTFPIKWNSAKKYYEVTDPENRLSLIVAKNDQFFGVLDKSGDQVSNYDFRYIAGQDSSTKDYLYMYSDRPLYRAGDTVWYKGLLRQFNFDGYKASPTKSGKLKVVDENGAILTEMEVKTDKNSNFNGSFVLPKDMPLGHYRFDFYAGTDAVPVYNNGEFDVLAYKKPTFKVNIATDAADASIGDTAQLSANAEYYFGGRLVGADYNYSVLTQSYFFDAKDYQDYQFGRGSNYFDCVYWGACAYSDNLVKTATGRLDNAWEAKITYEYPKTDDADHTVGEKIYTYSVEVTDPDTTKTVSNSTSQILHTTDAYVGVKVPYWNPKKDGIKVSGVVLDYGAKGLSGRSVKLELWKREWKEIKKQGVDGIFYNEASIEEKKESEKTLSSDNKGEWSDVLAPKGDGEYEIRALYTGENKQTFTSSSILYVSGESTTYWNEGNNTVTDLIADKTQMKVGETAMFTLKSPVSSGKMLITIEKDDGVLDSFVRDLDSTTPRIEVPIKESYVPNFYVKVFLIGQDAGAKLPTYKRALAVMKVTTDPKKLSVTITPEKKQYLPGDKVKLTITVRDSEWKPVTGANGSISLVDESLLALAGNPLKNPFAFFYDMKRYLGIETYISLMNLIEKLEVKDTSLGEKGGAGEGTKGGSSTKKRGVFKDTAFWQADFTTDNDGKYTITTDLLPDNLTTWVVEALVSTTLGNRVGIATTQIMTTKTVLINENLPRFLGSADRVTFSPIVFNKTGRDQSFDVSMSANNITVKSPTRTVFIKNGESYTIPFEATITEVPLSFSEPFSSKITLKAVAKDSGELDEVENTLPIVQTSTRETVATVGKTTDSADEKIQIPEHIRKNGGSLTVSYAASVLPNILSGIEYLKSFPYGCSEQRTSAIMPTVYLKQLYDSVQVPFDLKTKMVKEYIDPYQGYQERSLDTVLRGYLVEIKNFQHLNGGFAYWMEGETEDFPLTISLVSALSEIRSIGYKPNDTMMENAIKYLKAKFYENKRPYCFDTKNCNWDTSVRLATIEAILDNSTQDYEAYKMYKLLSFDKADSLTQVNRTRVLAKLLRINTLSKEEKDVLRKLANEEVQNIVSNELVYNPRGAFLGSSMGGSRLTATTRFLETLAIMGPDTLKEYTQIIDQMERWILSQKQKDGSFGSTADTSNVVRSLAHVMRTTGELRDVNMLAKLSLDTTPIESMGIDQKNKLEVFSKTLGLDRLQDTSTLQLEKTGQGNLSYDIALSYQIPAREVFARDEGFFVEQAYYDYNAYKSIKKAKDEEWARYMDGSIAFSALKYPKDVVTYLKPLEDFTVGKLVYVANRIITGEARDLVAFEGLIPSGSELVNPELQTENAQNRQETIFEHEEFQNDRYFGTVSSLEAGVYAFGYILRPTHVGEYQLLPSKAFEFYHPEVFGRTGGKVVKIQ